MASEALSDPGAFLQRKLRLFTDPDSFFEEQLKYPYIWQAVLLVILAGVAFMFQGLVTWWQMPIQVSTELTFGLVMLSFIYAGAPVMLWLIMGVFWRVAVLVAGGDAKFYTLLRVAGYGFAPFIVTGAAWSLGRYLALDSASLVEMQDRIGLIEQVQGQMFELETTQMFAAQALDVPMFQMLFLVGLLFTSFSVFLWMSGVSKASGLSKSRSLVLVLPPYLLFVWWTIDPVFL